MVNIHSATEKAQVGWLHNNYVVSMHMTVLQWTTTINTSSNNVQISLTMLVILRTRVKVSM